MMHMVPQGLPAGVQLVYVQPPPPSGAPPPQVLMQSQMMLQPPPPPPPGAPPPHVVQQGLQAALAAGGVSAAPMLPQLALPPVPSVSSSAPSGADISTGADI